MVTLNPSFPDRFLHYIRIQQESYQNLKSNEKLHTIYLQNTDIQ